VLKITKLNEKTREHMNCPTCTSGNQREFYAEINVHSSGQKKIDHPGILVFPKLLVCLDCGFSRFTLPEDELVAINKDLA